MGLYRKKPLVIEAFRWTGDAMQQEDPEWAIEALRDGRMWFKADGSGTVRIWVQTREGPLCGSLGDWIIKGIEGELYPCSDSVFAATYEGV